MSSDRWKEFVARVPKSLEFVDFAGAKRVFHFSGYERETGGYTVTATEAKDNEGGYEFSGSSYASPDEALVQVLEKLRTGLATRHLDPTEKETSLLAFTAAGRVASGGVVVAGTFIAWSEFTKLMQTHEGWEFKLVFSS